MTHQLPTWTWTQISRAAGLTLVMVLLVLFVVSFFVKTALDRTITLAFLGIASGLIGIPSGWQLVKRNNAPK